MIIDSKTLYLNLNFIKIKIYLKLMSFYFTFHYNMLLPLFYRYDISKYT